MKSDYTINVKADAEAGIDTVELQSGGLIIIPQVKIQMTAGRNTFDVTHTVLDDGMRTIKEQTGWHE